MRQQICRAEYITTSPRISWEADKQNTIGQPNSILKRGINQKQSIMWFEHLSDNRMPSLMQLIHIYQHKEHIVKRLDKGVFLHQNISKLNSLIPMKLSTKEIIMFQNDENNIRLVHIYQPSQSGMTTYENKWINFVEQFSSYEDRLIYKMVLSYEKSNSQTFSNLCQLFVNQRLQKIINLLGSLPLINVQMTKSEIFIVPITHSGQTTTKASTPLIDNKPYTPSVKDDPTYNEEHLRLPKLSNQQKQIFCKMQEQFPTASDNELCRFLIGKSFNLELAITTYSKYLTWKAEAISKYTMDSFKQITDKRMFIYCGKDKKGRPVIYNQTSAVIPSELNQDLYCEFYKYYFEIYLPSKMSGYVDQIMILANGKGLGLKNFKLSLTKRNMSQMLEISPERQAKLIAVNANWFGTSVWSILKPLIPAKSANKIAVYGSNMQDYIPKIEEIMDISIIPNIIGGENEMKNNY